MSITARGGYQIVDFKNVTIYPKTDNVIVKPDSSIIGAFENVGKKPFVIYNVHLKTADGTVERTDPVLVPTNVLLNLENDNSYFIITSLYQLSITPETMYYEEVE